jgi:hypothetical protein
MTFVNEYISPEDVEKYHIKEINKQFFKGHYKPDWTIDRERDIWLRYMTTGREDFASHWNFALYWKGRLLHIQLEVSGGGKNRGEQWRHYKILRLGVGSALQAHEAEIKADLKEALVAFRDAGVQSTSTQFTATFDF